MSQVCSFKKIIKISKHDKKIQTTKAQITNIKNEKGQNYRCFKTKKMRRCYEQFYIKKNLGILDKIDKSLEKQS